MDEEATRSKAELNNTVMEEFQNTIRRLQDRSYEVCLPWIREDKLKKVLTELAKSYKIMATFDITKRYSRNAMVKTNSSTTPIRPVDASSKSMEDQSDCGHRESRPNNFSSRRGSQVPQIYTSFRRMKVYQHCRVVFGVTSSPSLLAAVLQYHLRNYQARTFQKKTQHLLLPAKFNLRDWEFAVVAVCESEKIVSTLGMEWNMKDDMLGVPRSLIKLGDDSRIGLFTDNGCGLGSTKLTKRTMLFETNAVLDPLG
ncbi:hypothetical protein ILUMI_17982, partial [Ignelater luminosus]